MSAPELSNPPAVAAPVGPYSHQAFVKTDSDILFIAGQVGISPDGNLSPDFARQAEEAFANIARILEANGMTPANLAKLNIFVVSGQPAGAVRAARMRSLGDVIPPATAVYVPQLVSPQYLIEVEAVACR